MSEIPVQRRIERSRIRFQARLEGGLGDRWIPLLVAAALTGTLVNLGFDRLTGFDTGVDLAGYIQASWLIGQGTEAEASLFGTNVNVVELHWSFIVYPLALLGMVVPRAEALIAAQAVAIGLATFPLWWLSRQVANLRVGASSTVVAAYALHPATHQLGVGDFQPDVLALPCLVGMAYFGATKKWFFYWLCVVLALACRADIGLVVALWGFVLLGDGERRGGLWTLGVGLVWSLGLLLVAQPILAQPGAGGNRTGYGGVGLGDTVLASLRNPLESIESLVAIENMSLIVALLAPVIFLPLLSLRNLLPALPLAGLYLTSIEPGDGTFAERSTVLLAFTMIAVVFALNRLGNMGVDRVFLDARLLMTLLAASVLLFVTTSPTSPYQSPWNWDERDGTDRAVALAVDLLEDDMPVRASPTALAALAERPWVFPLETDTVPTAVNMGFPGFTRAVVVVEREIPERSDQDREAFERGMTRLGFDKELDDRINGVYLYVRR